VTTSIKQYLILFVHCIQCTCDLNFNFISLQSTFYIIIPPLIERGLYCNHLVCPSVRSHFRNRYLTMYPFTFIFGGTSKFLGVQSLTLHLGVQRKLSAFSPHKVVHHAVFCKYYAELAKTFFFCLTLSQTGSGVLSDPWSLKMTTDSYS
jgi:hypothetical protein